jgi:hypothetical protein
MYTKKHWNRLPIHNNIPVVEAFVDLSQQLVVSYHIPQAFGPVACKFLHHAGTAAATADDKEAGFVIYKSRYLDSAAVGIGTMTVVLFPMQHLLESCWRHLDLVCAT